MKDGQRGRIVGGIWIILALLLGGAAHVSAATFTVNTVDDTSDGTCDVTHCSLREAIDAANALGGADTIIFNIAGAGVHTIVPLSPLPAIEGLVTIDGTTQPGAAPNTNATGALNATLLIELVPGFAPPPSFEDQQVGLLITSHDTTIRGLAIHGFSRDIRVMNALGGLSDIYIIGNYLGTTPNGDAPTTPSGIGVEIVNAVSYLQIGTANDPADRNLISGHTGAGVWFARQAGQASSLFIESNLIGTAADGLTALGNAIGISLNGPPAPTYTDNIIIGGAAVEQGNVISGNGTGISVRRVTGYTIGSVGIYKNRIGVAGDGVTLLGNTGAGVLFQGEENAGVAENIIAGNGAGVVVMTANSKVTIRANSIYANTLPGIDLGGDGRTANDAHDLDSGPNDLQNFPVLRYAVSTGPGSWVVYGTLRAEPNRTYFIDLYNNGTTNQPGYIGVMPVQSFIVATGADGIAQLAIPVSTVHALGDYVTATATNDDGMTSEFSDTVQIIPDGPGIAGVITDANGGTPLPNVTVTLSGSASDTTLTDATGTYYFLFLQPGNYTVTPTANGYTFAPPDATVVGISANEQRDFAATAVPTVFTVNSTAEPGDGVCDAAECTFREALDTANAHLGADTIAFNIPGAGVHTITWDGDVPEIADALTIDGFTQPGSSPNTNATGGLNAVPLIELSAGPLRQSTQGLLVNANNVTIRGLAIHGFYDNISLGCGCGSLDGLTIAGNYLGTTPAGTLSPLDSSSGVTILDDVTNTVIGGLLPADRNLLSGNFDAGIYSEWFGPNPRQVTVIGNLIGTDATGQAALPNGIGIWHTSMPVAQDAFHIGGATTAERNVLSGNQFFGIVFDSLDDDADDADNDIRGNHLGLAADGVSALGNGAGGVFVPEDGTKLTVRDNVFAHNGAMAIDVEGDPTASGRGVTISGNSIFANADNAAGIDLGGDDRTSNDADDSDTGPNGLQNFPEIISAQEQLDHSVAVMARLQSRADETYTIQWFTTGGVNRPGRDAKTLLGSMSGTADENGLLLLAAQFGSLPADEYIVATATDALGKTSEISDAVAITPLPHYGITGTITLDGAPLANVAVALTGTSVAATTTNGSGQFAFVNLPATGSYTITPTRTGYTFAPPSATVVSLSGNAVANFVATSTDTEPEPEPEPEPTIYRQYLAEGVAGAFWRSTLSVLNPSSTATTAHVRYGLQNGTELTQDVVVTGPGHVSFEPAQQNPTLFGQSFSTTVESTTPLVASRTVAWGGDGAQLGAHAEHAVSDARLHWYFAEGATGCFDLFYLFVNPNDHPAEVDVTYMRRAPDAPITQHYTVPAHGRQTVPVNDEPGLKAAEVAGLIAVTNNTPIVAERAMYSSCYGTHWRGGHDSTASSAPETRWFFGEGATGSFFDLYLLVANFETQLATVDVQYLLTDGTTFTKPYQVPAQSRLTIDVAGEDPRLANAVLSAVVTSTNTVPVVTERSQWWPHGQWYEGHASAGATQAGVEWQIAGAAVGGPDSTNAYLLIANTADTAGSAQVRVVFADGTTAQLPTPVPLAAHSRTTLSLVEAFPQTLNKTFGVIVESLGTTPAPVVVELSVYNDTPQTGAGPTGPRLFWGAGTNIVATRVR